ncbi:hypothetical protein AK830_g9083 [Neonectria ditissima]|uniref:Uncharacterized protein n=1 Tax=Neonectria ditissima TaxID=78410 RepID=A0A0P7B9U0_9HYPO|nr:hypothetical protein AK830_g9083 [Neonectria ditissima]
MDPFNKLPAELCVQIFSSLGSFKEVVVSSHASPALFHRRHASKIPIIRQYYKKDLDADLIQDCMAIILFPTVDRDTMHLEEQKALVDNHLYKWGAKELSDPFEPATFHFASIVAIDSLCARLWLYIEDYLSKATSDFLDNAYRLLPAWSCHAQEFSWSSTIFQLDSLSKDELRRILQAFLRYELLCKVYGPIGGKLNPSDDCRDYKSGKADEHEGYQFRPNDPFRYWDWNILSKYEGKEPHTADLQLLPCVREYVLTLYGALIADQVGDKEDSFIVLDRTAPGLRPARLEDPAIDRIYFFEHAPSKGSDRFTDFYEVYNHYYQWQWPELYRLGGAGWSDPIVSLMATAGFDLLTSTLTSSKFEFRHFIVAFHKEMSLSPPITDVTNVNLPISAPSRWRRITWHCNSLIRLYRQRAWPLLENNRHGPWLYPDGEGEQRPRRLPTVDEYCNWCGTGPVGGLGGWGLEGDDTRNERICHGRGFQSYPSLSSKLVPCWRPSNILKCACMG